MTTDRLPFVSIVIPIYNAEKWLHECLDSLISQTDSDFEAILIDDGSTDESGHICDNYQEKYAHFRVIHQINCGLSHTRNIGLERARGEYVAFLDADDVFHPQWLTCLRETVKKTNADLIWWHWIASDEKPIFSHIDRVTSSNYTTEEILWGILDDDGEIQGYSCTKAFRRSKIQNTRYAEALLFQEDVLFACEFIANCGLQCRCVGIDRELYWYRQHRESICHRPFSLRYMDILECRDRVYERLKTLGIDPKILHMLENDLLRRICINNKKLLLYHAEDRANAFRRLDELYNKYRSFYRQEFRWTLKVKIYLAVEALCSRLRRGK